MGTDVQNYCGLVGSFLADGLYQLFGVTAWLMPMLCIYLCYRFFRNQEGSFKNKEWILFSLILVNICCLFSIYFNEAKIFSEQIYTGGLVGLGLSKVLKGALNTVGASIVLWSSLLILSILFFQFSIFSLKWPKRLNLLSSVNFFFNELHKRMITAFTIKSRLARAPSAPVPMMNKSEVFIPIQMSLDPALDDSNSNKAIESAPQKRRVVMKTKIPMRVENWDLPKINLLDDPPATRFKLDEKDIKRKADILTDKLAQFSVTGEVVAARPGPAVTLYEFKPSINVRLSKITELEDDLALALSAESLRILAPIPGRDVVGIETSNSQREMVYHKDLLADDEFWKDDIKLPVALGKQVNGDPKIVDLRKMPHLMIAGTTGSGKSVFTVSLITGLLFRHSPKTLRLVIIDPKQVDLVAFEKIPHLALPLVTDTRLAVNALKWAVREMEKRYRSMNRFAARGLEAYNETVSKLTKEQIEEHEKVNSELELAPGKKGEQYYWHELPYIVIVVEEFGDLMSVDKGNVEHSVVRLAQMARACGIHLILAMQSPRKEVVTGLIKTNIPGRISFKVNASMDSRIILDEGGAERLLAQGDMLFKSPGGSNLIRHHGPFLKDAEIHSVAKFWAAQGEPIFDPAALKALEPQNDSTGLTSGEDGQDSYDERYDEILAWASSQKEISASLIQRRFQLGYPRAARIVETFEREGVVGPASGSKPRTVLVSNLAHLTRN